MNSIFYSIRVTLENFFIYYFKNKFNFRLIPNPLKYDISNNNNKHHFQSHCKNLLKLYKHSLSPFPEFKEHILKRQGNILIKKW